MDILKKVTAEKDREKKTIENAFKRTPKKYHDFIVFLEQSKKLLNYGLDDIPPEAKELEVYSFKNSTYIKTKKPYMKVDGRLAWFADAHKKEDNRYHYEISSNLREIADILKTENTLPRLYPLIVEIDSTLYGHLEGESRIFLDGKGTHRKNPLENAKTSALGRAIAQAGIGLIGTGVASFEEIKDSKEKVEKADPPKTKKGLTTREDEIKNLVGDNEKLKNELYSYLSFIKNKRDLGKISIDNLTEEEFSELKSRLKTPLKKAN